MSFIEDFKNLLKSYNIIKSDKKEEMISYEVIYEPDTLDSHNQWMSKDTIEKACEDFNKHLKEGIVKSNLFHVADTDTFTVEDTWVHRELDVVVTETDQPIKAGTWIAKVKYNDPELWELKKAGVIGGVSIGAKGFVNEETGEITELSFAGESEDQIEEGDGNAS